jgi:hypothetical protein
VFCAEAPVYGTKHENCCLQRLKASEAPPGAASESPPSESPPFAIRPKEVFQRSPKKLAICIKASAAPDGLPKKHLRDPSSVIEVAFLRIARVVKWQTRTFEGRMP